MGSEQGVRFRSCGSGLRAEGAGYAERAWREDKRNGRKKRQETQKEISGGRVNRRASEVVAARRTRASAAPARTALGGALRGNGDGFRVKPALEPDGFVGR